ncbi:F-box protein SKIP2-like [Prosopis cineraria]|uniref:F-box protein SKIP2-like n=1 Tax=Prosopis cineraria TaxID=364024 RepID=UPI00240EAB33|nr:F-box protein SKIP2-like [Prosopis cineraria]
MGQSTSTPLPSADFNRPEISSSNRYSYQYSVADLPLECNTDADFMDDSTGGFDYTAYLPDDCLAGIFQLLGSVDRRCCSLVCKRWMRVDGQSRHRLSLIAQAALLDFVPSLFNRFDSVTKLALRCERKSNSINDDALILISLRCENLTRLKLRGCREVTEVGMAALAKNCKALKKLSLGSCMFGVKGLNAVVSNCTLLEELSVKRLRGTHDGTEMIDPVSAASSLKSICLKELVNSQSFAPLVIGSKGLRTLKVIRCMGDWDNILENIGKFNAGLIEVHLEKIQVSDVGLSGISNCLSLETLHIVKTECSNVGLSVVAERCKLLRKLHIHGWRTNMIGDDGLIAVAKHCIHLQELVLIGLSPTSLSLTAIASNCRDLERFALCGIGTIGDAEIECISAKCVALKKLCIKACPISNVGIEALASGCPNLVKIKVKKCRKVTGEVVEWLRRRRVSLAFSFEDSEVEAVDGSGSDNGAQDSTVGFTTHTAGQAPVAEAASSSNTNNNRLTMLRTKFGFLIGRNIVPCPFRRWSTSDNIVNDDFS